MTMTPYVLDDLGGRLSIGSLAHFVRHLPLTSATKLALDGGLTERQAEWVRGDVVAELLAVLVNELRAMQWMYQSANSKTRIRQPKPFVTPWNADEELGVRRFGKGAIPISGFWQWWDARDEQCKRDRQGEVVDNGDRGGASLRDNPAIDAGNPEED